MLDQLAYKMQPAGHEEPEKRRKYPEPDKRVADALENFLDTYTFIFVEDNKPRIEAYVRISAQVRKLQVQLQEAYGCVLKLQDHPNIASAGLFLSAVYNNLTDKVFEYDLDLPLRGFGYCLAEGKIIINKGKLGHDAGYFAQGHIINFGEAKEIGAYSSGILINYGKAASIGWPSGNIAMNFGEITEFMATGNGIVINAGVAHKMHDAFGIGLAIKKTERHYAQKEGPGQFLNEEECSKMPELFEYVENIRKAFEPSKHDLSTVIKAVDSNPVWKIKQDVHEILRRHNYNVKT